MPDQEKILQKWEEAYTCYDYEDLPWETLDPDEEIVRIVKENKMRKGTVLDVGCGAGTNSIFLAERGLQVVGVDISPSAIAIAEKRAREAGVMIKFIVANAYELDLRKESFNLILDRGCFHHIPKEHRKKYIKQNHNLLKKNGMYYLQAFSDSNKWQQENLFSVDRIKSYFGRHFKILESNKVVHTQPDMNKVYLNSVLMKKRVKSKPKKK